MELQEFMQMVKDGNVEYYPIFKNKKIPNDWITVYENLDFKTISNVCLRGNIILRNKTTKQPIDIMLLIANNPHF